MFRRIDEESDTDKKLIRELEKTDAMYYPHHCSYEIINSNKEWNVEICSSWRVVMEECDFTMQELLKRIDLANRHKKNRMDSLKSSKLGFIGSSDAHRANPGMGGALTGIYASSLTPHDIFDAYKNRRTVATQGFAVFIDFRVGDIFIGGHGRCQNGEPPINAEVDAPDKIEYIDVIRDGTAIFRCQPDNSCSAKINFKDSDARPGSHFYFLKLKLKGDPGFNYTPEKNSKAPFYLKSKYPHNLAKARGVFAWTSPIWIYV